MSSTVVVLPLEPVTARNGCGSRRHATSSSPITSRPWRRARATTGASCGTPGLLTMVLAPATSATPSSGACTATPARSSCARTSGDMSPASQPATACPCSRSASAAATPDRARPTTRKGPDGSGGRAGMGSFKRPVARLGAPAEAYARVRVRTGAQELDALRLQPAADRGRVAQRGRRDAAVLAQDAVRALHAVADQVLVEGARVLQRAARRQRHVAVARPAALRDRGHHLAYAVGVHLVVSSSGDA